MKIFFIFYFKVFLRIRVFRTERERKIFPIMTDARLWQV